MKQSLMPLLSGLLFGLGLGWSQMIDRDRVLGFLDVTGVWDPTLLFVLGGAVTMTVIAFRFVLRRSQPLWVETFHLPTKKDIDRPLVIGSAIFGVGNCRILPWPRHHRFSLGNWQSSLVCRGSDCWLPGLSEVFNDVRTKAKF